MEEKLVVFVLGAPGAGKGTQCELVRKELGWSHISAGDLLRAQVAAGTEVGKEAEAIMKEGKLVPSSMIIGLLKDAISSSEHTKVLIDGFPRVVDQLRDFEQQVRPCSTAFFYKVSDSTALERLNKRAESSGRVDDNEDTIRKRFVVFEQDSMPVVDALRADGRLVEIDAAASPEVVYGSTKQAIQQLQEQQQQLQQQAAAASSAASAALPDEDAAAIAALSASQSEAIVANSLESTLESSAAPAAPETAAAEPEAEASQLSATSTAEFREMAEQSSAQQVDGDVPAPAPVTATDAAVVSAESSQHDTPAVEASKEGIQHISAAVAALDMSGPEDQSSTPVQLPAAEAAGQLSTGSEAADIPVSIAATQQEPAVADVSSQQIDLASIRTPFVICGPSGVGKGTLINKLMTQYSDKFGFSVSHTTRAPRPGEQHGVHYDFTDIPSMKEQVAAGLFLEHAEVHGNMYGTSLAAVAQVSSQGKHCVLDIDVQGARLVKASALGPLCCFIFVAPPSHEELERRLRNRGTETEEKVLQRLANAKAEIEQGQEPGLFDHILVNADLEAAYNQLQQLINQAVPELLPTLASVPPALSAPAVQITEAPAAPGSNSTATEPAATLPVTQEAGSTPQVASANGSTTTSQHTPATAVAASTGTSTLLDFGFGASAGPAVAVKGMPVRQYMDATVIPVLREGLKALNTARPDDPLQYLADFLVAHKPATH